MIQKIILSVSLFLSAFSFADSIEGIWQANKKKGGKQGCLVQIYKHESMYYGQIIATYDDLEAGVKETIDKPIEKAPGIVDDPYYCGINMVWVDSSYEGHIVDPEAGEIYRASLRRDGEGLVLKGKFGPFFSNRPWPKAPEAALKKAFPKGLPDSSKFDHKIPTEINGKIYLK